jgi:hypothetical protein
MTFPTASESVRPVTSVSWCFECLPDRSFPTSVTGETPGRLILATGAEWVGFGPSFRPDWAPSVEEDSETAEWIEMVRESRASWLRENPF